MHAKAMPAMTPGVKMEANQAPHCCQYVFVRVTVVGRTLDTPRKVKAEAGTPCASPRAEKVEEVMVEGSRALGAAVALPPPPLSSTGNRSGSCRREVARVEEIKVTSALELAVAEEVVQGVGLQTARAYMYTTTVKLEAVVGAKVEAPAEAGRVNPVLSKVMPELLVPPPLEVALEAEEAEEP